jgi:phosphatidylserine/phosphatidylglycerophosphate/cardiolipin synthase-like enzyme
MPWHDITVQIKGGSVHDLTRHFIQYWNFVNFQTRFNER